MKLPERSIGIEALTQPIPYLYIILHAHNYPRREPLRREEMAVEYCRVERDARKNGNDRSKKYVDFSLVERFRE